MGLSGPAPVVWGGFQHTQVSSAVDEPRARSPPQEDNYLIIYIIISMEAACNNQG